MKINYTKSESIKETADKKIYTATHNGKKLIVKEFSEDKREIYTLLKDKQIPGIPKIYSIDLNENTVITEEYIEGISLYEFIRSSETITLKTAVKIALETATIISNLHALGIIHRDITPSNIFICKDEKVYIVDFDIARIYKPNSQKDTRLLGTVGYAPPEQFGFGATDYKSDIYAFGMTMKDLFFLVKEKHLYMKVLEKCTAFDPDRRYQSMSTVVRALNRKLKKAVPGTITVATAIACVITLTVILIKSNFKTENFPKETLPAISESTDTSKSDSIPVEDDISDENVANEEEPDSLKNDSSDTSHENTVTSPDTETSTPTDFPKSKETDNSSQKAPSQIPKKEKQSSSKKETPNSVPPVTNEPKQEKQTGVPTKKDESTTPPVVEAPTPETPKSDSTEQKAQSPQAIEYKCFFCNNPPVTVIGQKRYCSTHAPKCTSCGSPLSGQNSGLCESCAFKQATNQ